MKQYVYGKDMKYKNAIFNLETGDITPIDKHLEYDEKGNICVKEKIVTIKKTIYKNGKPQQPVYECQNKDLCKQ
ncbi:MAG: hypothetical protein E7376_00115 [Clostridiales bacterium]|nr:hypothetical protein [Clostridiales bacterium]